MTKTNTTETPSWSADKIAHTPGPWRKQSGEDHRHVVIMAGDRTVLDCDTDQVSHADARLIAAAPELLFALRNLVADFESGYIANPSARADARRDKHLKIITAAISKAGG